MSLPLTDEQRAALTAELAQLEQARLDLLTGKRKALVQYDNRKVEYAAGDTMLLYQRITEVKALLGQGGRRAISVSFGRR